MTPAGRAEPALGDAARDAAIRAIARQARDYPDFRPDPLAAASLRPADSALARAIYAAAIQHWLTLGFLLDRHVRQGFYALEPAVQAAMLAGATQLLFLDRVPAYAAINQAVEWAKQDVRPGAGALVNAVLRRIADFRAAANLEEGPWTGDPGTLALGSGRVIRSSALQLPDDPLDRLSLATSHPRPLLEHWKTLYGEQTATRLALHSLVEPPVVLNVEHATPEVLTALEAATSPHENPHDRVLSEEGASISDILGASPGVWVQDSSSAGAIRSVADLRPALVADMCAGQGTKTRQLAAAFPDARIIATDIDPTRFAALERAFTGSTQVSVLTPVESRGRATGQADLVLLDVPCSNIGVLSRRPEARYRWSPASVASLTTLQRRIITDAIPLLSSRGAILYSTCSIEPDENQGQGAWIESSHPFQRKRERFVLPSGSPGEPAARYHDGAYSVLFTRR